MLAYIARTNCLLISCIPYYNNVLAAFKFSPLSIPNNHELHLARTAPVTLFCPGFYTLNLHFVIKFYHRSEEQ